MTEFLQRDGAKPGQARTNCSQKENIKKYLTKKKLGNRLKANDTETGKSHLYCIVNREIVVG